MNGSQSSLLPNTLPPEATSRVFVTKAFLDNYEVQRVGGKARREYWIPAEDLAGFNAALVGEIEVIAEFTDPA